MTSEKILLFPTVVRTLSGVLRVVPNSPTDSTVPVMPPAVTKSPTLKGRRKTRNAPAAKFAKSPLHAEDSEDGDDQHSVQYDRQAGLQVACQRHVELLLRQRSPQETEGERDQP